MTSLKLREGREYAMDTRFVALGALIIAPWLAIAGVALIACWLVVCCLLLYSNHSEHLISGSVSLALAVAASVIALKLDRNAAVLVSSARPEWGIDRLLLRLQQRPGTNDAP
jgi:hypothetical protein